MARIASIEAFKATMKTGFARPNLFKVFISRLKNEEQLKYQMRCFQAQIPGHNIATTDKDSGFRSIAYQKIYSDIILGFYVDADLKRLKFWQEWIDRIVIKGTSNRHNYYDNYIGQIKITQENRLGHDVATWTLHDAYPKQVDPIQLDYGTNDAVMTCNATITYRHFDVVWFDVVKKETEQTEAQYAVSSNTEMNKINPMLEILLDKQSWNLQDGSPNTSNFAGWDNMSPQQRNMVNEYYRIYGQSKSGGALHSVSQPV